VSVSIFDYIEKIVPKENILFNEPMSRHTTFRVGGAAKCLIKINNKEQLKKLVPYLQITGQKYLYPLFFRFPNVLRASSKG